MVAEAASQYQQQPWFLVPTGGIIALTVLSLGLLGDALRDAVTGQWTGHAARARPARSAGASQNGARRPRPPRGNPADAYSRHRRTAAADPATAPLLSVRDLRITVPGPAGGIVLVSGMSFDLLPGRTLAIVGESGCGKSVTARALLGVAPPGGRVDGSIRLRRPGRRSWPGRARRSGGRSAAAGSPSSARSRCRDSIPRRPSGQRCARSSAPTPAAAGSRPGSGRSPCCAGSGWTTRSGSRGSTRTRSPAAWPSGSPSPGPWPGDPEILVADEPTTALDVTIQADILALLRSLQLTSGIAVLLVTHDWGVVAGLADDVLVMYAGQAVERSAADGGVRRAAAPVHRRRCCGRTRTRTTPGRRCR